METNEHKVSIVIPETETDAERLQLSDIEADVLFFEDDVCEGVDENRQIGLESPIDSDEVWAGAFVPKHVVWQAQRRLGATPDVRKVTGAFLFVDICGFTRLGGRYCSNGKSGIERFTAVINTLFSSVLSVVRKWDGDVDCFAGDAILVVFDGHLGKKEQEVDEHVVERMKTATLKAARCANEIVKRISPFKVDDDVLEIHAAMTTGMAHCVYVGGDDCGQRGSFFSGKPMQEIAEILKHAGNSNCVCSVSCKKYLEGTKATWEVVDDNALMLLTPPEYVYDGKESAIPTIDDTVCSIVSSYMPKPARVADQIGHSAAWLAEMRHVTVAFVRLISVESTAQSSSSTAASSTAAAGGGGGTKEINFNEISTENIYEVNEAIKQIVSLVQKTGGATRQITLDDKGLVVIFAYGLPGMSHMDDATRGLRCALKLGKTLEDLKVKYAIGIATGPAFCGLVGCEYRCEYACVGDTVNLAARLCQKAESCDDHVLCCNQTAKRNRSDSAKSSFLSFNSFGSLTLKGMLHPQEAFIPAIVNQRPTAKRGVGKGKLIGRDAELSQLRRSLELISAAPNRTGSGQIFIISGSPGVGKSKLIRIFCKEAKKNKNSRIVTCVPDAQTMLVPYGIWRRVITSLLSAPKPITSNSQTLLETMDDSIVVRRLPGLLGHTQYHATIPYLRKVFPSLNSVPYVRSSTAATTSSPCKGANGSASNSKVENCSKAVIAVLQAIASASAGPAVIVIDDAELMDPASWHTAREISANPPNNMMLILSTRGSSVDLTPRTPISPSVFAMQMMMDVESVFSDYTPGARTEPPVWPVTSPSNRSLTGNFSLLGNDNNNNTGSGQQSTSLTINISAANATTTAAAPIPLNAELTPSAESSIASVASSDNDVPLAEAQACFFDVAISTMNTMSKTPFTTLIVIEPLDAAELQELALSMMDGLDGVDGLTEDIVKQVAEMAEGNPLFMRELLYNYSETGMVGIENNLLEHAPHVGGNYVPEYIRALISSRADRLPSSVFMTLKVAAVIGREFDAETILAVHPFANQTLETVISDLNDLEKAHFIARVAIAVDPLRIKVTPRQSQTFAIGIQPESLTPRSQRLLGPNSRISPRSPFPPTANSLSPGSPKFAFFHHLACNNSDDASSGLSVEMSPRPSSVNWDANSAEGESTSLTPTRPRVSSIFCFTHGLYQSVAVDMLLHSHKAQLHRAIAVHIENSVDGAVLLSHYSSLVFHWSAAIKNSVPNASASDVHHVAEYYYSLISRSFNQGSIDLGLEMIKEMLGLVQYLSGGDDQIVTEYQLRSRLVHLLIQIVDVNVAVAEAKNSTTRCKEIEKIVDLKKIPHEDLLRVAVVYSHLADMSVSASMKEDFAFIKQLLQLHHVNAAINLELSAALARYESSQGDFSNALWIIESGLSAWRNSGRPVPLNWGPQHTISFLHCLAALLYRTQGNFIQSRNHIEEAVKWSNELPAPDVDANIMYVLCHAAVIELIFPRNKDYKLVKSYMQRALESSELGNNSKHQSQYEFVSVAHFVITQQQFVGSNMLPEIATPLGKLMILASNSSNMLWHLVVGIIAAKHKSKTILTQVLSEWRNYADSNYDVLQPELWNLTAVNHLLSDQVSAAIEGLEKAQTMATHQKSHLSRLRSVLLLHDIRPNYDLLEECVRPFSGVEACPEVATARSLLALKPQKNMTITTPFST